jgi:hypothetical protein
MMGELKGKLLSVLSRLENESSLLETYIGEAGIAFNQNIVRALVNIEAAKDCIQEYLEGYDDV